MAAESYIDSIENLDIFEEAMKSKTCSEWKKAMERGMASLKENQPWVLINLSAEVKAISCK